MLKTKESILETLISRVKSDLEAATLAAAVTSAGAKDESMKSDGKYDTRAIEAGQLAGAQLRRVEELKLELQMLEEMPKRSYTKDDEIGLGALVDIKFKGQTRKYFICSTAGGTMLQIDGVGVLVISVFSPIGDAVLEHKVGDTFELETPSEVRQYEVIGVA